MSSGIANSCEACAANRSACAPAAAAQFPRWIEAGRSPDAEVAAPRVPPGQARRARRVDAARHARQPRVQHDPLAGVDPPPDHLVPEHVRERHQRGERVVPGRRSAGSASRPSRTGRRTSSAPAPSPGAGSGSSSTSSRRTGANRDTNARRSTRPPMAEAASRARLCRNTSAFTSSSRVRAPHGRVPHVGQRLVPLSLPGGRGDWSTTRPSTGIGCGVSWTDLT